MFISVAFIIILPGVYELDTIWYWVVLLAITTVFRIAGMIFLRGKASFK
jgi:hypothetical protein